VPAAETSTRPRCRTDQAALVELQDTLYRSKNPTRRWIHARRRDLIEQLLRSVAGPGVGRALEIGPGSGIYLPLLAGLAGEVVVTDIEPAFLDRARELMRGREAVRFVVDDICRSVLEPSSFDLILCTEVIEHIAAWRAAVASIARLLRPGGVLVLSTPQPWSPLEILGKVAFRPGIIRIVKAIYREPILATGHISLVSGRQLGAELGAHGLRTEQRRWSGVYLPVVAEIGGRAALRLEQALEAPMLAGRLRPLLWTQYVVARR
jgi:SAM-dependent methyltransferase